MNNRLRRLAAMVAAVMVLSLTGCSKNDPPAQITVMSWNLLNPSWGGPPVEQRVDAFIQTVEAVLPDVMGVQEASTPWHEAFRSLPDTYAEVCAATDGAKDNMTMFLYNTDTLELLESGIDDLDADSNIRVVSWAVFEVKGTSRQFLITNTHPDSREAECLVHTEAYLDIAAQLYDRYALPMLAVGDFNAVEDSAPYQLLIDDGFTDTKYADGVELVRDIDSYLLGDYGGKITIGQGSRDHVFFKGAVTPVRFETLYGDTVQTVSDHLPVAATVTV